MMAQQGLSTIGIEVVVGIAELNYVTDFSDLEGTPSSLDVTCLRDDVRKTATGVVDTKAFEISYLFDNSDADSDFRKLKVHQQARKPVMVAVTIPDGTVFRTMGTVVTYVTGSKVNELLNAKLVVFPQGGWEILRHPYEIVEHLQDSYGNDILDSSGELISARIVL